MMKNHFSFYFLLSARWKWKKKLRLVEIPQFNLLSVGRPSDAIILFSGEIRWFWKVSQGGKHDNNVRGTQPKRGNQHKRSSVEMLKALRTSFPGTSSNTRQVNISLPCVFFSCRKVKRGILGLCRKPGKCVKVDGPIFSRFADESAIDLEQSFHRYTNGWGLIDFSGFCFSSSFFPFASLKFLVWP